MNVTKSYTVMALDVNGTLRCLGAFGWQRTNASHFMTLAFARHVLSQNTLPLDTVDCYVWSTEHEVSFPPIMGDLVLAVQAVELVNDGKICYENAEILSRIPRADWQMQFLGEAVELTPKEFAELVHGLTRRFRVRT